LAVPQKYRIQLVLGDAYELVVSYVDTLGEAIDLDSEAITHTFYDNDEVVLALTEGNGITVSGPAGIITTALTSVQVAAFLGLTDVRHSLRLDTSETTILYGVVDLWQNSW